MLSKNVEEMIVILELILSSMPNSEVTSELISSSSKWLMSIDWFQIALELFVTVLGFFLAIWSARVTDIIKARSDTKELKRLIKEELKKINDDLKNFNEKTLDVQPLRIPLWESAINTGQLSLLDFVTREKLFRVYNTIREFNSWCLVHTNYYFEKGKQNELLIQELSRIKGELLKDDSDDSDLGILSAIRILKEKGEE